MEARRVVTGHDDQGRSIVVADERVNAVGVSALPGVEFHRVWGADATLTFPDAGAMPAAWRNEGAVPATIAFFICGADHQKF